jgi:hypothetical protein
MVYIPIDVLLSWPERNAINPVERGPELWIASSISLSIATLCVGARLYSRIFIRRWFGLDDALILVAFVCCSYAAFYIVYHNPNTSQPDELYWCHYQRNHRQSPFRLE